MATHRIYMSFFVRGGGEWVVGFLEPDLKTSIGRGVRRYGSEEKVREIIARGNGLLGLAAKQAIDAAFEMGRGGVFLTLTDEQYRKLQG